MKILVIEDEKVTAQRMCRLISEILPDAEVLGPSSSIASSREILSHETVDLIFADIRLEDGLSFSLLDSITTDAVVVFTTAYNEFAIRAFDYNCVSYILKPVQKEDVEAAIEKYRKRYLLPNIGKIKEMAQSLMREETIWRRRIIMSTGSSEKLVSMSKVVYVESEFGITKIFLEDGEHGTVEQSLVKLVPELDPDRFLQISRQNIVAIDAITEIKRGIDSRPEITVCCPNPVKLISTRLTYNRLRDILDSRTKVR